MVFKRNNVQSGWLNTSLSNTSFGVGSLPTTTTGDQNTALGVNGLKGNTTGRYNTGIGMNGLVGNTTGNNNTSVGANAMFYNTTGSDNTAVGYRSGRSTSIASGNTSLGSYALEGTATATPGNNNTAVGFFSLRSNSTGGHNTAVGVSSLYSNTDGNFNIASGSFSLTSNTTGSFNTANGYESLRANTTGNGNTGFGFRTLPKNTTGANNTASGYQSLENNTTGNGNTVGGYQAMFNNAAGNNNTAMGNHAGYSQTAGDNNIMIGTNTEAPNLAGSNQMNIGNAIFGTGMTGSVASPAGNIGIGTSTPTKKIDVNGEARIRTLPVMPTGTPMVADADGNVGVFKTPDPNEFILYYISPNVRQNSDLNVPLSSILNIPQTNAQDGGGNTIQPVNCWVVPNSEVVLRFPVNSATQRGLVSWNLWFEMAYPGGFFSKASTDSGDKFRIPLFFHSRLYARVYKKDMLSGIYNQIDVVTVSMKTEQISPYLSEASFNDNSGNPLANPGSSNPNYRYFISASYNMTTNLTEDSEYKLELLYGIENFSSQNTITNTSFLKNWGVQSKAESYIKK